MEPFALLAFLWVGVLLPSASYQDDCVIHGRDGVNGVPGRDGFTGPKGEKGQPALQEELNRITVEKLKGDIGSRGTPGEPGPKGFNGGQGPIGLPGPKGPKGSREGPVGSQHEARNPLQKPAFSVLRNRTDYASYGQPVIFDNHFSIGKNDFNLDTGYFTCKVSGVYYFVFHASSEGRLCLRLRSDNVSQVSLSFCNFNPRSKSLVVSGGAVLKLSTNNKVWIEPFTSPNSGKMLKSMYVVFNGFLIYRNID